MAESEEKSHSATLQHPEEAPQESCEAITLGEVVAELDAEDAQTVKASAEAISRLVFGKEAEKERAGQGGAIEAIVRAFRRHSSDREVTLVLLKLLRHVCFGVPANVEVAAANGGIVAVASCLRCHQEDEEAVAEALWALSVLGKHPGSEAVLARVHSDVQAATARHPEHPQIAARGMYLAAIAQLPTDDAVVEEDQAEHQQKAADSSR